MEDEKFYRTGTGVAYWLLMYPMDSYGSALRMLCGGRGPWYGWRDINSLLRTRGRGGVRISGNSIEACRLCMSLLTTGIRGSAPVCSS